MKLPLLALWGLCLITACRQPAAHDVRRPTSEQAAATQSEKVTRSVKYRCDGCSDGLESEWLEKFYTEEPYTIVWFDYWNSGDNNKTRLVVLSQEHTSGEISGSSGTFKFPDNPGVWEFGMVENELNVTAPDGRTYGYEAE